MGDGAAACDQAGLGSPVLDVQGLEKGLHLLHGADDGDLVLILQHKIAGRDEHLVLPLYRADQDIAACGHLQLLQVFPCRPVSVDPDVKDHDPAPSKGVDPGKGRMLQQLEDLQGRRLLRVDDLGKSQLFLQELRFLGIEGVPDSGDGFDIPCPLCDQTGQQIQLVRGADCDKDILGPDIRLLQGIDIGSVSEDWQDIHGNMTTDYVRLKGLIPGRMYREEESGRLYPADALMQMGVPIPVEYKPYRAYQIHLIAE